MGVVLSASARLAGVVVAGLVACACAGAADDETAGVDTSELRKRKPAPASTPERAPREVDYRELHGLRDAPLKRALYRFVADHESLGYDRARDVLLNDRSFVGDDGKLECVYTGRRVSPDGSRHPSDFNTEHSWPQSSGALYEPARSDLHHLFAVDGRANSVRNNHPFGTPGCVSRETECKFAEGGSALGEDERGELVFEVRRAKRGDVARAHFYFAIRYGKSIAAAEEAALREWHETDPVTEAERDRTAAIARLQGTRNPFVDRPDLVAAIDDF